MSITNVASRVNCGSALSSPVFSDGVFIDSVVLADFFRVDLDGIYSQLFSLPASIRADMLRVNGDGSALWVHKDLVPGLEVVGLGGDL